MRKILSFLFLVFSVSFIGACSDDATQPPAPQNDGTISGQIRDSDFEFEVTPGEPGAGPFLLIGKHIHYDDEAGALVVDLMVLNGGSVAQREPIGLTFIKLDPDEVSVLNPDNDVHNDGAAIVFHFANDDGAWTPGEESLPRTVQFGVSKGTSIAFIARIDLGAPAGGGIIAGRVWDDANKNGEMESDETGLVGVGVYLSFFGRDPNQPPLGRVTTTGREGLYQFDSVPAGGYVVSIATETLIPTTPTEIHVLLVDNNGEVSSYRGANFGALPQIGPPPPLSQHVHALGKFAPPDHFVTSSDAYFTCPDPGPEPLVTDPPINEDCVGGTLRGTVTEVAPLRNGFRIMATWVMIVGVVDPPLEIKVGARLDVHVHQGPGPAGWVADSISPWSEDHDEIQGRIDAIDHAPDGTIRIFVLQTWLTTVNIEG
jgi:SdrD B-like domain